MTGVSQSRTPVVALDVDGVLNPALGQAGYTATPVHVPASAVPDSPFLLGRGRTDINVTVYVNPAHGSWINALREHADVVWATTWESMANDVLAPLLGIPALEVATSVAADPPWAGYAETTDSAAWKAEVLADRYRGRPLVWVDDAAWRYETLEPGVGEEADPDEAPWSHDEVVAVLRAGLALGASR